MRRAGRVDAGALLVAALWGALGAAAAAAAPPVAIPEDSVYRLPIELTTQAGERVGAALNHGRPTLVTMFYGSCTHACPLIVATLQMIERELGSAERAQTRVLMVSIDPDRDSPASLRALAERHRIDTARWTLAHASSGDVRSLAAVLGVRYRALPDGEFNHSTVLALLDRQGRIVARTSTLGQPDEGFMEQLRRVLADRGAH